MRYLGLTREDVSREVEGREIFSIFLDREIFVYNRFTSEAWKPVVYGKPALSAWKNYAFAELYHFQQLPNGMEPFDDECLRHPIIFLSVFCQKLGAEYC